MTAAAAELERRDGAEPVGASADVGRLVAALGASVAPQEAQHRSAVALGGIAGSLVLVGSVAIPAFAPGGAVLVALAALVAGSNLRALRRVRLAAIVSGARNELAQGHLGRAERLVAWVASADSARDFARPLASVRAEIALARGDLERAARGFDAALALTSTARDARDAAWIPMIQAERALTRALSGDDEGALADAAAIRELVEARAFGPRIVATVAWVKRLLARAALAEIVVAARAGDPGRVEALAAASRRVVLDGVSTRERTLFRAIERMARARRASVYRQPAELPRDEREAPPAEWVERVLPGASAFVRARGVTASDEANDEQDASSVDAEEKAPSRSLGTNARLALLWGLVGVVVFSYMQVDASPRSFGDATWYRAYVAAAIASVVVFAGILLGARGSRPRLRAANDAMVLAATDPSGAALANLEARDLLIVAVKAHALAQLAFERADLRAALAHANVALEALGRMRASADLLELRGMVHGMRSVALAAQGHEADARASAAQIPTAFTGRAAALAGVDLFAALAAGRVDEARGVAERVSDHLPLDTRTELVVDLLRSTNPSGGLGLAESARLRAELEDAGTRAFVRAVAPTLLDAADEPLFGAVASSEADAQREAEAEEEAARDEPRARVRAG